MRVALISALGRAGRMREAMEQLEAMGMGEGGPGWNVFALNAGLAAAAVHGEWRVAEAVWRRLIADGVKPDTVSYRYIAVASLATYISNPSEKLTQICWAWCGVNAGTLVTAPALHTADGPPSNSVVLMGTVWAVVQHDGGRVWARG
jgi:hypothetical protein